MDLWFDLRTLPSGFLGGGSGQEPACQARDVRDRDLIPGLRRPRGGGRGHPLQDSCLENPMDRGAWWASVHGVTKRRDCQTEAS